MHYNLHYARILKCMIGFESQINVNSWICAEICVVSQPTGDQTQCLEMTPFKIVSQLLELRSLSKIQWIS